MKWFFRRNREEADAREEQRRAGEALMESIARARADRDANVAAVLHKLADIIGEPHDVAK